MPPETTGGGRVALVTGAAQGLGQSIAVALAQAGYHVAVSSHRPEQLQESVRRIEATGRRATAVELDLRLLSSIEDALLNVEEALGGVDVLINNAGVTLRKSALDVTPGEWDEIMAINLTGTYFVCQAIGRRLVARGSPGSIVNIGSVHGLVGYPERSTYGISKAGVMHMTRMLAIEWASSGIRVNAVAPGTVETPARREYFRTQPEARDALLARVPASRFCTPEDVAAAVCFLAGPKADYITGQILTLDGGLTAC